MRNDLTFRCDSGRLTPAWPGDPACGNVHGGLNVGVSLATGCTRENVAAPDSQSAALRAGLAGVGRINVFGLDSAPLGFVGDKRLKLAERPARHHPVGVLVSNLASFPNAREPLHPDRSGLCAFGFGHDGLTEVVVFPSDAPAFTSGLSAQRLMGTPVVSGLQRRADLMPLFLELPARRSRVQGAVRGGSRVADTEIHTHGRAASRPSVRDGACGEQIPMSAAKDEITFSALRRQQRALSIAADERDVQPAVDGPDGNRGGTQVVGEDALVKSGRSCGAERALRLLVELVGIGHFGNTANGALRRQAEVFACSTVAEFMQLELSEGLGIPCLLADRLASGIASCQRACKGIRLSGSGAEFQLRCQVHLGYLLLLNVLLNRGGGHRPGATDVIASAPKGWQPRLQQRELCPQFVGRIPLDLIGNVLRSMCRRSLQEQVNVVWQHLKSDNLTIEFGRLRRNQDAKRGFYLPYQNLAPVFRTPDEVIGQRRNTAANVPVTFNAHNFYSTPLFDSCQLKSASSARLKPAVSALEII